MLPPLPLSPKLPVPLPEFSPALGAPDPALRAPPAPAEAPDDPSDLRFDRGDILPELTWDEESEGSVVGGG